MVQLPTIKLDTTIADLYRQASPSNATKHIAQVLCGASAGLSLSEDFPRNVRYLYQDKPFNSVPKDQLTDTNRDLQRSVATKYLCLVPQRDAFISGDTTVVLFDLDSSSHEQMEHDRLEVQKTIEVLDPAQQPKLLFCTGPSSIPVEENKIDMIACKVVLDQLQKYPPVFPLDKHWYVNSKAALARSGLPTPDCEVLEIEGLALEADKCCAICVGGGAKERDELFILEGCTGERGQWLLPQINRIVDRINARPLPFVVKNQQTFGGAGTYMVKTEDERADVLRLFSQDLLRKLLSRITAENAHLGPATILLSDLVKDPIGDYGLTFFVKEDGGTIFLAVSEQMMDEDNAWIGSTITYSHQKSLEEKFGPIMEDIAKWLRGHDYFGPVGADVLETRPSSDDGGKSGAKVAKQESTFNIVDLNIRTSGSMCLPLLRGHFERLGLDSASSFQITTKSTREEFIQQWRQEFVDGRIFILSWYEDTQSGTSIADVAVGGKDGKALQELMNGVQVTTEEVTF